MACKTISDASTISRQHQWEVEKIARERTLHYYETKLSEISNFVIKEINRITSAKWSLGDGPKRIVSETLGVTEEWLTWASSTRTFVQTIGDEEIVNAYATTYAHLLIWNKFISTFNSGSFDAYNDEQTQKTVEEAVSPYMKALKDFQLAIEKVRIKVLRGEIIIK